MKIEEKIIFINNLILFHREVMMSKMAEYDYDHTEAELAEDMENFEQERLKHFAVSEFVDAINVHGFMVMMIGVVEEMKRRGYTY